MIDTERSASTPVLAQDLRLWRIKRNLSQEEAAQQSGVSRDTISRARGPLAHWTCLGSSSCRVEGARGQRACR